MRTHLRQAANGGPLFAHVTHEGGRVRLPVPIHAVLIPYWLGTAELTNMEILEVDQPQCARQSGFGKSGLAGQRHVTDIHDELYLGAFQSLKKLLQGRPFVPNCEDRHIPQYARSRHLSKRLFAAKSRSSSPGAIVATPSRSQNHPMQPASFVGLDVAWNVDVKHSGVAVLVGDEHRVRLTAVSEGLSSLSGVVDFITRHSADTSVVAVDASLVVVNETGQRPCEREIGQTFGQYGASCHSTNTKRPYADTGQRAVKALASIQNPFVHDFNIEHAKRRSGRWLFEVYPHPAMIRLFGLSRIIRYKRGPAEERRHGLATLCEHLESLASKSRGLARSLTLRQVLAVDLETLRGERRKRYEDTLDAIFCAYLAWYCWRWGGERNETIGTLDEGYIVVPKRLPAA